MRAKTPRKSNSAHEQELLDEALEETFPASDPPALLEPGGGITTAEEAPIEEPPPSAGDVETSGDKRQATARSNARRAAVAKQAPPA